jgi:hypothetical protein
MSRFQKSETRVLGFLRPLEGLDNGETEARRTARDKDSFLIFTVHVCRAPLSPRPGPNVRTAPLNQRKFAEASWRVRTCMV